MEAVPSEDGGAPLRRGPLQASVRQSLNEAALQLAVLNRRVGVRLELKDADLECLNLVFNEGPLTPSVLARRAALHPATVTGVLDRLEREELPADVQRLRLAEHQPRRCNRVPVVEREAR